MKMLWMIASISLLVILTYSKVGGVPSAAAQRAEQSVTMPVAADIGTGATLTPQFSEYLFLHQTRYENLPVHAMVDVKACSE